MTVLHPITMVIGPCTAVLSHKVLTTVISLTVLYFEGETYVGLFPTGAQNCLYYGIQYSLCPGGGVRQPVRTCLEHTVSLT